MDTIDNADFALEMAVQGLGLVGDFIGSDSETEETAPGEERSEGPPNQLLEEEQDDTEVSRSSIGRMYSPAPSQTSLVSEPRQPVTLDTIVQDHRLFNLFRRFLKDQCTTRNLHFWLACEHYRKLVLSEGQQHLYEVAKALYTKFIKSSAPQRVTLLEQTRKYIKLGLDLKQRVTPDLFITAQKEIWNVMNKNELRQFLISGNFADCPSFASLADSLSLGSSVYTPSMANPNIGVCGGGSLQHSGSEDSASVSSYNTESDVGPRSCIMQQLSRPFPTGRNAVSDCESNTKLRHQRRTHTGDRHHSAYVTKDKPVTEERFAALLQDRLAAVCKDREAMTKKVRERARQEKKNFEEIMALEWYDLPEAFKYLQYSKEGLGDQLAVPFSKPIASPQTGAGKELNHINSLALREVQQALKDMEITNQVNETRRPFSRTSGSSSVLSTTSDSGVGDTLATSGLVTPHQDSRLKQFVYHQNSLSSRTTERERDARAAAMSLIHASPQPECLNPIVRNHHPSERPSRRPYSNYPEAYSSDDSSSCFTVTTHSSASDLFIPKRQPQRSTYSDNDEHHSYAPRYHNRRTLAGVHRSKKNQLAVPPSPIVEHQQMAAPPIATPTRTDNSQTLVVYHLDQIPTPYAMRVPGSNITLREFKEKVLRREGNFRFFFKSFLDDIGEFLEECSDDNMVLPLYQGKIMGRVERLD